MKRTAIGLMLAITGISTMALAPAASAAPAAGPGVSLACTGWVTVQSFNFNYDNVSGHVDLRYDAGCRQIHTDVVGQNNGSTTATIQSDIIRDQDHLTRYSVCQASAGLPFECPSPAINDAGYTSYGVGHVNNVDIGRTASY